LGKHVYDNNNYMKIPKNYCGTLKKMPIWKEFEENFKWKLSWYIDKTNPR
jgi:hypothetical protein